MTTLSSVVLVYHRVGNAIVDPWALAVSRGRFQEHLDALEGRPIVHLRELVDSFDAGRPIQGGVAITFDDGYAETAILARPLLEAAQGVATFYLTSGALDSPLEFWWDELERIAILSSHLPDRLELDVDGEAFVWTRPADGHGRPAEATFQRSWRGWEEPQSAGQDLYRALWQRCQRMRDQTRQAVIEQLRSWAGESNAARVTHRLLTRSEARDLAAWNGSEIGAHTVTHPALSALTKEEQWSEITTSKTTLESLIAAPVTTFAYPFGRLVDYSTETIELVRAAGFKTACSNFSGAIEAATDRYQIPRLFVQDWDGAEFGRQLAVFDR